MKTPKAMKTEDELISHMKNKGIKFELTSEEDAKKFLMTYNYYFKLSAYRENYDKCPPDSKERAGQYQNLDFAYLKELSIIDKHLRYLVLEMCLDIEHSIKVHLIESVEQLGETGEEDGYRIVKEFLKNPDKFDENSAKYKGDGLGILKHINAHKAGEYCSALYNKYYPYFPIWVLVELISFGDLIRFTRFYDDFRLDYYTKKQKKIQNTGIYEELTTPKEILLDGKFMNIIRDLRNASAHSNCLINKAADKMPRSRQADSRITGFVSSLGAVSNDTRKKYLHICFTYNMVVLFYVYRYYLGEETSKDKFRDFQSFLNGRVIEHADYFTSNQKLVGVYNFLKKVVDKLAA